jgi:hypothetical protein
MIRSARRFLLAAVIACAAAACTSTSWPYQTAAYRFTTADPSALLIFMPKQVRLSTRNATLAGPDEINVETDYAPIDLSEVAARWGAPLAQTLHLYRDAPVIVGGDAAPWSKTLRDDPRRSGVHSYRLLLPYSDAPPPRSPLDWPPPNELSLDGPGAKRCLIRVEIVVDNAPKPQWHEFEPQEIARHFEAKQLFLVGIESLTVYETGGRPQITARLGGHLVDLQRPLLAASFTQDLELADADGPAGVEAALCGTTAQLRAGDWQALRQSLLGLGERVGHYVALNLGWINDDRLAEAQTVWKKENSDRLKAILGH